MRPEAAGNLLPSPVIQWREERNRVAGRSSPKTLESHVTRPSSIARPERSELPHLDDSALVELARAHHEGAIRTIVRRYNQRLFRVARAIVRNDADAEDVVQVTYVKAFSHLDGFRGEAQFSTWRTRIAVNEVSGRGG